LFNLIEHEEAAPMTAEQSQAPAMADSNSMWQKVSTSLLVSTGAIALIGTLGIAAFSWSMRGDTGVDWLHVAGILSMVSMAAAAIGALFGFLFAVPRTPVAHHEATITPHSTKLPNTNLEQISDWLTKVLVGATLTQMARIPDAAREVFNSVGGSLGVGDSGVIFTGATILFGLTAGFILGWLATRTWVGRMLTAADDDGAP
jgi:hypothetical protein